MRVRVDDGEEGAIDRDAGSTAKALSRVVSGRARAP
jgi:hypothetical protein